MNYQSRIWIKAKNQAISVSRKNGKLHVTNPSGNHGFLMVPQLHDQSGKKAILVKFFGRSLRGDAPVFQLLDLKRTILSEVSFNSEAVIPAKYPQFFFSIKVPANAEFELDVIDVVFSDKEQKPYEDLLTSGNRTLIIAPSYPTEENKYFGAFVHSRAKAYQDAGIGFDLAVAHVGTNNCKYSFEDVKVHRMEFITLRELLQEKHYDTILLHFFDDEYARILDAVDLEGTKLFFWVHGPETLYWDWPEMTDPYFVPRSELTAEQVEKFRRNDALIRRYNDNPNVHWIFVSKWIKDHSEKLIDIRFKNYSVIPNFIDEKNFAYAPKDPELRWRVFMLRRFENISKYAIDINVRTILELSRREIFSKMQFDVYGTGLCYDTLVEPLRQFDNVHLHQHFMTHSDIAKAHREHGIGLFATRYDAQGVSMCEAAMSGLAIISSQNDAIAEFLPTEDDARLLCETENPVAYADRIEELCRDPEQFLELSRRCHEKVLEKCCFDETIRREIDTIRAAEYVPVKRTIRPSKNKVLSVIIPSYHVAKYLRHGVGTLLNHDNAGKMEIIIVNDGSKDNTAEVAEELRTRYGDQIITVVNKENGGHGSTINTGLKLAKGKYTRVMDGDDWVKSEDLGKLIDYLQKTDADIVVTDYSEDIAFANQTVVRKLYNAMQPERTYRFDDLCYEVYGFGAWGPILATGNFKTEMLRAADFKLTEKSFYIDMEFDVYSILRAETVEFLPLDIYRYYIGRSGQSISRESYTRNYRQHENVIMNLLRIYTTAGLSERKKWYVRNKIIIPMIVAHYTILTRYLHSGRAYWEFEQKLSAYPEFYEDAKLATRMKKIHRATRGHLVLANHAVKSLLERE